MDLFCGLADLTRSPFASVTLTFVEPYAFIFTFLRLNLSIGFNLFPTLLLCFLLHLEQILACVAFLNTVALLAFFHLDHLCPNAFPAVLPQRLHFFADVQVADLQLCPSAPLKTFPQSLHFFGLVHVAFETEECVQYQTVGISMNA